MRDDTADPSADAIDGTSYDPAARRSADQTARLSYDPFTAGPFPVGVATTRADDPARDRRFPVEVWYPAAARPAGASPARDAVARPGTYPLVAFSHQSGGHRRSSSFLGVHLAGHGYVVASLDHSEVVVPELARRDGETAERLAERARGVIDSRVPDLCLLLDHLLEGHESQASEAGAGWAPGARGVRLDAGRVGVAGHSLGGWTALAVPDVDHRVRAVVALAPGGSTKPLPGVAPLTLTFAWGRDVPTLYLAAEEDRPIPPASVADLFDRTPASRRMFVLRRADHQHFADDVEREHEAIRASSWPGDAAWIPPSMRPMAELCGEAEAHRFVRGLALAHLDATLMEDAGARRFLAGDVEAELAARGVDSYEHRA